MEATYDPTPALLTLPHRPSFRSPLACHLWTKGADCSRMDALDENKAGADWSDTAIQHIHSQEISNVWRTVHSGLASSHLERQRMMSNIFTCRTTSNGELTWPCVSAVMSISIENYISGPLGSSYPTCPNIWRSAKRVVMIRYGEGRRTSIRTLTSGVDESWVDWYRPLL